ncbi:type II toxin-antitoxin system VapC family toxin [Pedobacter faecalis]|uniref:type II toxin-antitoxin system VapC family toxin n=1 Tax=Pedobacter faecalis TaxID=3041495 RepID=UPI0025515D48|nr:type II toxin-antitoxin system VapC family toxin [Pedobacter sp. ELA7]
MGKRYLIDSNAVIDFFNGKMPPEGRALMTGIEPIISVITQIELFSGNSTPEAEIRALQKFVDVATIYPLSEVVALETISLRKAYRIKLPDAVIAATAMAYGFVLITRNTADFKHLKNLDVINPYEL